MWPADLRRAASVTVRRERSLQVHIGLPLQVNDLIMLLIKEANPRLCQTTRKHFVHRLAGCLEELSRRSVQKSCLEELSRRAV